MLGDKIDELTAKVTGTRVIAIEGGAVKVELSITGQGKVLGTDVMELATYHSVMTPAIHPPNSTRVLAVSPFT